MKKIAGRAVSVLLLAALVLAGLTLYGIRYIDHGKDWALYFSRLNSLSGGQVLDRDGRVLAHFDANDSGFSEDPELRMANYHVTGDYWGRSGTGILSAFWQNARSFSLATGTTKGSNSQLTLHIDGELNRVAYRALAGRKGAILLCNYRTGELLSMVSTPVVDPADPNAVPEDGAYLNRCLSAAFIPGSVFKLVTAAAAIENLTDVQQRQFYCEGSLEIAGVEITCVVPHYTQTFEQALANSCNVAFARMGIQVGQDTLVRYVKDFGFLSPHELDGIPTASGSFPTEFVGDPELGWASIGQSTDLVCPYSLLRYVCAIANDGVLVEPRMVQTDKAPEKSRFLSADTAHTLRDMMRFDVVEHYGGDEAFPGLALCAKTGTAELGDGTTHAWFTGFLADEEHPYAFVVLVERGGGGMTVASPIANTLLQAAVREDRFGS